MEGRMDGREERKRKAWTKAHGLDDGGRILETQGKGTTSRRVESLDIWTCRDADHPNKKIDCVETRKPSSMFLQADQRSTLFCSYPLWPRLLFIGRVSNIREVCKDTLQFFRKKWTETVKNDLRGLEISWEKAEELAMDRVE